MDGRDQTTDYSVAKSTLRLLGNQTIEELEAEVDSHAIEVSNLESKLKEANDRIEELESQNYEMSQAIERAYHSLP